MADVKDLKKPDLILDDSVKQNKRGEAILGRLYGPCADIIHSTRNGRKYPEKVWETVFNSEIINEFFDAGGLLGELDHPEDRIETCTEKVAICMPEKPTKDKEGHLVACFDILDTPNGRIAYTLAKYGYKLGISSRGDGEVFEDYNGEEIVDANTFDLRGFDLVLLPAVKAARLKMVESVQKSFKQALTEAFNKSDEEGRKIQQETLKHLGIDFEDKEEKKVEENIVKNTAVDDGVNIVDQLQEALKENLELNKKVSELQEQLSVSYAKDNARKSELDRYKNTVITLSESAKQNKSLIPKVKDLEENLTNLQRVNKSKDDLIETLRKRNQELKQKNRTLNEDLDREHVKMKDLQEGIQNTKENSEKQTQTLKEDFANKEQDYLIKMREYKTQIASLKESLIRTKKVASTAISRYIDLKARSIGVPGSDIKNRLTENYSFKDIDRICDDLQEYQLNMSRLPFDFSNSRGKVRVKVTEAVEPIKKQISSKFDDDTDSSLFALAGIDDDVT